jgi:hypothetical protein
LQFYLKIGGKIQTEEPLGYYERAADAHKHFEQRGYVYCMKPDNVAAILLEMEKYGMTGAIYLQCITCLQQIHRTIQFLQAIGASADTRFNPNVLLRCCDSLEYLSQQKQLIGRILQDWTIDIDFDKATVIVRQKIDGKRHELQFDELQGISDNSILEQVRVHSIKRPTISIKNSVLK